MNNIPESLLGFATGTRIEHVLSMVNKGMQMGWGAGVGQRPQKGGNLCSHQGLVESPENGSTVGGEVHASSLLQG